MTPHNSNSGPAQLDGCPVAEFKVGETAIAQHWEATPYHNGQMVYVIGGLQSRTGPGPDGVPTTILSYLCRCSDGWVAACVPYQLRKPDFDDGRRAVTWDARLYRPSGVRA